MFLFLNFESVTNNTMYVVTSFTTVAYATWCNVIKAARFDDLSQNIILTIWRFMLFFWRFLKIKNLHHIPYFSTLKATLGFVFASQLLECSILLLSCLLTPVMIFQYFMPFSFLKSQKITNSAQREFHICIVRLMNVFCRWGTMRFIG